jgi:Ca2+-transporting ATPase
MQNLGKALSLLLAFAFGIALLYAGAALAGFPAPLLPVQLVWTVLVTAAFPAVALAFGSTSAAGNDVGSPRRAIGSVVWEAIVVGAVALVAYWWGLEEYGAGAQARTVAVLSLAGAFIALRIARSSDAPWILEGLARDHRTWAAGAWVLTLQAAGLLVVPLRERLGLAPPATVAVEAVLYSIAVALMVLGVARAGSGAVKKETHQSD